MERADEEKAENSSEDSSGELASFCRWLELMPDVATVLRKLRERQRLTLEEIATYAELSISYVDRVERGLRRPERDTLITLLLASFTLPPSQASQVLLMAGYAPLHHRRRATLPSHHPE
ncbi:MAG TPA: helix-turn-helix transcriptional regulator [Ktedonobacterales bacterium]|nr:helix-turn-helix transcriptional regulator [Ktedonobacterales bacterium]